MPEEISFQGLDACICKHSFGFCQKEAEDELLLMQIWIKSRLY